MIGNRNYVRKHYPEVVKVVENRYDEIEARYRKLCPRAKRGRVQIALERHVSAHTWAWHGIRAYKAYKSSGQVNWHPASFYGGYAYIRIEDIQDILDDLEKEERPISMCCAH